MKLQTKLTLLSASLLVVMAGVLLFALRLVSGIAAESTAKNTLESALTSCANSIEYEDGTLKGLRDRSYIDGAYVQVFSADGSELLAGSDVFETAGRMTELLQEQEAGQVFHLDTGEEGVYCYFLWKAEEKEGKEKGRIRGGKQGLSGKTPDNSRQLFGKTVSDDTTPEAAASDDTIPKEMASGVTAAEGADPETASPGGTMPEEMSPGVTAMENTGFEAAASDHTISEEALSEETGFTVSKEKKIKRPESGETGSGVWIVGLLPEDSMENVMASVERLARIGLPVIVLLAAFGAWLLIGRSLRSLQKITESAREISDGHDLSRRIELSPGRDEVHELAETFNDMMGRLERAFDAERQFTSDASHELRTPTAVILAECEMAEKMPGDAEAAQESIVEIHRQARKMSELIGKLLSYTRLEQGTRRIEKEALDLSELVEDVCEEQRMVAVRGITIESEIEPDVTVDGDAALLISLVQNLVSNAVKYGKDAGHVLVRVYREDHGHVAAKFPDGAVERKDRLGRSLRNGEQTTSACVLVRDDGIGISKEDLERIWNRFYQADRSRSDETRGVGLGLSLAQQIARLHGGAITAESTPGEGSSFLFSMPARKGSKGSPG